MEVSNEFGSVRPFGCPSVHSFIRLFVHLFAMQDHKIGPPVFYNFLHEVR